MGDLTYESYFPDNLVPEYRPHLKTVAACLVRLKARILRSLALALDLDKEFFMLRHKNVFREGNLSTLRCLYYPAIDGTDIWRCIDQCWSLTMYFVQAL